MIAAEPQTAEPVIKPATPEAPPHIPMVRDQFTWLAYVMIAFFAYIEATLGPLMTFLRQELNMNYTVAGFHLSAFAIGATLAGLTSDRVAQRWGRRAAFWGGGIGMAAGGVLITIGHSAVITIAAAFVQGFFGFLVLIMIQALLSDKYRAQRTIALTEANIFASAAAGLAPLAVGLIQGIGIGWRGSMYLGALALVLIGVFLFRTPVPPAYQAEHSAHSTTGGKLPRAFWSFWLVVLVTVSIEWSIIFWAADFLQKVVGLSPVDASAIVSLFFVAELCGRIVGNRLARTIRPASLLLMALLVSLGGFLIFWLSPFAAVNIIGLFVAGLGIANLYPLTLSITTSLAPDQANLASARTSLASGIAILLAPEILAWAADQISIRNAMAIILVLCLLAITMTFAANRAALRRERA